MALVQRIETGPLGPRVFIYDAAVTDPRVDGAQPGDQIYVNGASQIWTGSALLPASVGLTNVATYADVVITTAQVLALFGTPKTILASPGAGFANIFMGVHVVKPAGTAYAGIAAGEDLSIKYTGTSGLEVCEIETTGFLDQTTIQSRYAHPYTAASAVSSFVPVADAIMIMQLLTGEITTGTSALNVRVFYRTVPVA